MDRRALIRRALAAGAAFAVGWVVHVAGVHPETGGEVLNLHPAVALAAYFSLIFAVANWPPARRESPRPLTG